MKIKNDDLTEVYDYYFYGVIYLLKNSVNNKVYIGKTKHLIKRKTLEYSKYYLDNNYSNNRPIIRAIRKYKPSKFTFKVIAVARNLEELNKLEKQNIIKYDSRNSEKGYNIAKGGEGGIGGPHFKDRKHSEQTKEKMRNFPPSHFATNTNKIFNEKWRKNIGIATSKRMKGVAKTDAHKRKLSKIRIGKSPTNKGKKLVIINNKRKYV